MASWHVAQATLRASKLLGAPMLPNVQAIRIVYKRHGPGQAGTRRFLQEKVRSLKYANPLLNVTTSWVDNVPSATMTVVFQGQPEQKFDIEAKHQDDIYNMVVQAGKRA